MARITGKIAAIISETRIVINRGKNQGVYEGMKFVIKLKLPEIKDPDNQFNTLSGIYFEKGNATVVKVFDGMSFADLEGTSSAFNITIGGKIEYPKVSPNMLISTSDWYINVGDEVEQA